jgi:predicted PurR-regulated permease PerM
MSQPQSSERDPRKAILFAFALGVAAYLAWVLRAELVLLYVSGLFAVVLSPVVASVGRFRVGRWQPFKGRAIPILLLAAVGAVAAFGFLALPPAIDDFQQFAGEMPTRLPALAQRLQSIPLAQHLAASSLIAQAQSFAGQAATYLLGSIKGWASQLFNLAMGCILTIYFLLEGEHTYAWFLSLIPHGSRDRLDRTLQQARVRMDKWLLGQGSLMLILGVTSTLVFLVLRVRYAYALGVLMGALNLIPVLGGAIGITLALLSAAIDSWGRVVGVAVFYLVYVQIENSFLTPRIMKNRVGLSGLAVLAALLVGSALAGVLGAMVSVPTAVLVEVLLEEYAVQEHEPRS